MNKILSKNESRVILKQIRKKVTNLLLSDEKYLNSVYSKFQINLKSLLTNMFETKIKSNQEQIAISLYMPFKDEIDIISLVYGSEKIKKFFNSNDDIKFGSAMYSQLDLKDSLENLEILKNRVKFLIPSLETSNYCEKYSNVMNFNENTFNFKYGKYGILESKETESLIPDIVILPTLGFNIDNKLNRIGYGKGNYDQTLNYYNSIGIFPIKIGVCYQELLISNVEFEQTDVPLDYVITQDKIY